MGRKKAINSPEKTFRLQFLFYALVFINFFVLRLFYGEKFKKGKKVLLKRNEHLGFQA